MTTVAISDSKQAILDAAQELLIQNGYAGLSMRELSRQSGLAKSTLYHYFADKHEIYLSVLEREMLLHQTRLSAVANEPGTAHQRLTRIIYAYSELINTHGSVAINALRRSGDLDQQLVTLFQEHRPRMLAPMIEIMRDGIAAGEFRNVDVDLTVMSLMGVINSFVAQRVIFGCDDEVLHRSSADLAQFISDLMLHGLLTEAKRSAA